MRTSWEVSASLQCGYPFDAALASALREHELLRVLQLAKGEHGEVGADDAETVSAGKRNPQLAPQRVDIPR